MSNQLSVGDKIAVGMIVIALLFAVYMFLTEIFFDFVSANAFCKEQGFETGLKADLGAITCRKENESKAYTVEEVMQNS